MGMSGQRSVRMFSKNKKHKKGTGPSRMRDSVRLAGKRILDKQRGKSGD